MIGIFMKSISGILFFITNAPEFGDTVLNIPLQKSLSLS